MSDLITLFTRPCSHKHYGCCLCPCCTTTITLAELASQIPSNQTVQSSITDEQGGEVGEFKMMNPAEMMELQGIKKKGGVAAGGVAVVAVGATVAVGALLFGD
jgi:hypothetical protein